jgi:hypothetical protein
MKYHVKGVDGFEKLLHYCTAHDSPLVRRAIKVFRVSIISPVSSIAVAIHPSRSFDARFLFQCNKVLPWPYELRPSKYFRYRFLILSGTRVLNVIECKKKLYLLIFCSILNNLRHHRLLSARIGYSNLCIEHQFELSANSCRVPCPVSSHSHYRLSRSITGRTVCRFLFRACTSIRFLLP